MSEIEFRTDPTYVPFRTVGEDDIYFGMTDGEKAKLKDSLQEILDKNQFGLVYNKAITENKEGAVTIHPVSYRNPEGLKLAANLYLPAGFTLDQELPVIAVAHPNDGTKEQVSGLIAQRLAVHGYMTLAFDAA